MKNLELGKLGENIAKQYLQNKGYIIIEQNCRNKYGEIDLIVKHKNEIIFVEVKTRIGEQFGIPEDALNRNKRQRLIRNANAYMTRRGGVFPPYRIDAVCIVLDENKQLNRINHYENIVS